MPRNAFTIILPLILLGLLIFGLTHRQIKKQELPPFVYIPGKNLTHEAPIATQSENNKQKIPIEEPKTDEVTKSPDFSSKPIETTVVQETSEDEKQSDDPKSIVKNADDLMRGDTIDGIYIMLIHTPSWERTLTLKVYSEGRNKTFIRILSPAKEAGIGTLRVDNEMWNYLPDIEKTLKIPPSMMLQPWMGSDFANDDLVKESSIVNDYNHQLLSITSLEEDLAYKIELTPKESSAVVWGKRIQWIRMKDQVPLKEEYYDEKNQLIKILTYSDIGPVSDRTIPRTWTMTSFINPGQHTTIQLKDVKYNVPLQNHIFTLQNLKKIQ